MKKFYLYLLLTALCYNSFSQTKLDSLKKVLAKLPPEGRSFAGDTMRVRVLCEMGEDLIQSDSCLIYFNKAIYNANKIEDWNSLSRGLNGKAFRIKSQKKYLQSIEMFFKAHFYANKARNNNQIGKAHQGIADNYLYLNQGDSAIHYYNKAIKYYQKVNNNRGILVSINNMAIVNEDMGNIQNAEQLYKRCIILNTRYKIEGFDGHIYNNLAFMYQRFKRYSDALENINKAIYHFTVGGKFYDIYKASTYLIWAEIEFEFKKIDDAKKKVKMGLQLNNNSSVSVNSKIYKLFYTISKYEKNYKSAIFFIEKANAIDDSVNKQMATQQLNSTKFETQILKQQDDLNSQSNELENKKKYQYFLLIILFIFMVFGFILWKNNKLLENKNLSIEEQKVIIENAKSELEKLNTNLEAKISERTIELKKANEELILKNYEITEALVRGKTIERKRVASELHNNLGSTLSALKWRFEAINKDNLTLPEKKIYESTNEMLKKAYQEIRLISHNLLPDSLEKMGVISAIQTLVNEINQDDRLTVLFVTNLEGVVLPKELSLEIYSITMELLNNILKYANAEKVVIKVEKFNNQLGINVEDNGKGIGNNLIGNSFGLKNIQERVCSINGKVEIESVENRGTKIQIIINL